MFLFVSVTSILSVVFGLYTLFAAALIVFTFHNLFHIVQPLLLRRYIPAMVSSIITLPYPFYVLRTMNDLNLFRWRDIPMVAVFFGALTFAYLGAAGQIGLWIDRRFNGHWEGDGYSQLKMRSTQHTVDVWDSPRFLSSFLALGFSVFGHGRRPAHTPLTPAVGWQR